MDEKGMEVLELEYIFSQVAKAIAKREARKRERKLFLQKQAQQIRSLMKNTNWTAHKAMDMCGMSSLEQKKLLSIL